MDFLRKFSLSILIGLVICCSFYGKTSAAISCGVGISSNSSYTAR